MVKGLINEVGLKPEEIAFFTQNDGYGDAGYQGGIAALKALGYSNAEQNAHGRYERNTIHIEDGLIAMLDATVEPRAIIMVGAYKPCAAFIKLAKQEGLKSIFLNVSFVGSNALAAELGEQGDGVIVTQVVPHYEDSVPAVQDFRAAMEAQGTASAIGFVALEGYLAARIFCEGLQAAGAELDRENHIDALEGLGAIATDVGAPLTLSKDEHQASHTVWPTIITGATFEPVNWSELK